MKYLVKKSVLLLLVVLAFCACDNSNDNGDNDEVIQINPWSSKTVVNYIGEVEFVVDAPQIREDIEQDLKANPPFGGSKKYQFITKKYSTLPAVYMLYAVNPEDDKSADGYIYWTSLVKWRVRTIIDCSLPLLYLVGIRWILCLSTQRMASLLQHTMCLCIKIFLLLWLIARCISAKTLRRNIARSSLMKTFMPWFAVWFFLMSVRVIL